MNKAIIIIFSIIIPMVASGQLYNPYVASCTMTPSPLYNLASNGTGQISFVIGNSGTNALPLITNQEMVIIVSLSRGVPNHINPLAAIGGTFANYFNWLYDGSSKTYQGTQNQGIANVASGGSGTITIQYKVTSNSISSSPQNGFNVNITPPPYTNGFNLLIDDQASFYTWTILKLDAKPDFAITQPGIAVIGNLATNDIIESGTTYANPIANVNNPGVCAPLIGTGGTYTFTCSVAGEYHFFVPVCEPMLPPSCANMPLVITVLDPSIPVNLPLANPDNITAMQGNTISVNVKANDVCENGIGCTLGTPGIVVNPFSAGATVVVNVNGTISYTPSASFTGKDSFQYKICDNQTPLNKCDSEWVYITVYPSGSTNTTNACDDFAQTNKGVAVSGNVKTNDNDPEGNTQTITVSNITISGKGSLVLTASGTFTFTPVSSFVGSVDFPYTICDNATPPVCVSATLHIVVLAPLDTDGDGIPNTTDTDDDADGIADTQDPFPIDTDNDGSPNWIDADDDGDAIADINELPGKVLDTDNDGLPNVSDTDDDDDGLSDMVEMGSINPLNGFYSLPDSDNDGLPDLVDPLCLPLSYTSNVTICANALPYTWNALTIVNAGSYTYTTTNASGCDSTSILNLMVNACLPTTLNLKCYLEGYYLGGGLMASTLANQSEISSPLACDSIDVQLRSAVSPYSVQATNRVVLNQNGTTVCTFPTIIGNYYIVINHRNTVQTWSALPVSFANSIVNYDFSVSASNAYAGNMTEVSPGIWACYAGDILNDENVDLLDLGILENDITSFAYGYMSSDLNGDGNVDLLDSAILELNLSNFIFSIHP